MRRILLPFLLVVCSSVSAKTFYVATNGSDLNNGTSLITPFATWQRGINVAYPGDTIFVRGGVYYITGYDNFVEVNPLRWPVGQGRTGTRENPIYFWAYPPDFEAGDYPILDCRNAYSTYETNFSCFGVNAVEYWHIKGITVRNAYQRGAAGRRPQGIGGTNSANIIFENCTAHDISARGFYFESGAWNIWDGPNAMWESDTTRWINCDAYNICDSVNLSSGDGWKAGNYYRGVFYFEGCRAWNYSDDGFDPSGAGRRIFNNCWAMATDKYNNVGTIEGNGFKTSAMGTDQAAYVPSNYVAAEFYNCIATHCQGAGFGNNLELGYDNNAKYFNNTSYHNAQGFFDMPLIVVNTRGIEMRNNLAYNNSDPNYDQVGIYNPAVYTESNNTWIANQETGYLSWPGWDEYNPNFTVTDADFLSLDSSQIRLPRNSEGSLPVITFLKLAAGSDLIDAGVNVGLPYSGSAPDIGYAEYGTVSIKPPLPSFVSAVIPNATPVKLEMTYSITLAGIVPAASAFSVKVNTVTRTVSSVAVSGTKVTLSLASPVVYGDAVTVAYTKPSANPLQTPDGAQAETLAARNVTNNVAASIPIFTSAVIQNATPAKLEMNYSLTLAGIVPAASAFTVKVNTVTRTVSSVAVSGTKVTLTLASPVVFGDAVTVAYTKPSANPLQTPDGAQPTTIPAQTVINNCSVTPNQPPLVNISSPTKSSSFYAPSTITIDATASDPDGTIAKVEFYNGQTKLGEVALAPYSFTWKEVPEGTYVISAAATDNMNARTISASVTVVVEKAAPVVNQLPVVIIKNPNKGRKYKTSETIVLEAEATDPDGTISKIEFKSGEVILAELTEAPYVYNWQSTDTGKYVITAIATDNLGAVSQSPEVDFSVIEVKVPGFRILSLYPNPNDGQFTVEMAEATDSERCYTIYSISGQALHNLKRDGQESTAEFNLTNLPAGTFVLTVASENRILDTRKFIKR